MKLPQQNFPSIWPNHLPFWHKVHAIYYQDIIFGMCAFITPFALIYMFSAFGQYNMEQFTPTKVNDDTVSSASHYHPHNYY